MNIEALVRENVKRLSPFSSARSEYSGTADILLDANESPFDTAYNRYPDPYQIELRNIIAESKNVHPDQLILGNGSDELIDLIVRIFCNPGQDIVRILEPTFGMYEAVAAINDVKKEAIPLSEDFQIDTKACLENQTIHHKIIFLCSPNNPTGNLLNRKDILEIIKSWNGIVVVDEAYIEFSGEESMIKKLDQFENLIVLQTFSKSLGGAGLRLGMGYASQKIIRFLNKVKPPYNVNVLTQEKAKVLLSQKDIFQKQIETINSEKEILISSLEPISGIEKIFPSNANFLLVRCKDHKGLYDFLKNEGIIVRDRSKLRACERCLRITIGLPKQNKRLIEAIESFYK